jgi:hypothetical protein
VLERRDQGVRVLQALLLLHVALLGGHLLPVGGSSATGRWSAASAGRCVETDRADSGGEPGPTPADVDPRRSRTDTGANTSRRRTNTDTRSQFDRETHPCTLDTPAC